GLGGGQAGPRLFGRTRAGTAWGASTTPGRRLNMTPTPSRVTSWPTRTTFPPGRHEKKNMAVGLLGWELPPGGGARASPRRRRSPAIDEREARKRHLRNGRAVLEDQVSHLGRGVLVVANG